MIRELKIRAYSLFIFLSWFNALRSFNPPIYESLTALSTPDGIFMSFMLWEGDFYFF